MLLSLRASACAIRPTTVPLEDGTTAYDIRCSEKTPACTVQAANVCGDDGYVVLEQDPFLVSSPRDQQGVLRIQCSTEYTDVHRPFTLTSAPPVAVDRQIVCRRAFGNVAETARVWSAEAMAAQSPDADRSPDGGRTRGESVRLLGGARSNRDRPVWDRAPTLRTGARDGTAVPCLARSSEAHRFEMSARTAETLAWTRALGSLTRRRRAWLES